MVLLNEIYSHVEKHVEMLMLKNIPLVDPLWPTMYDCPFALNEKYRVILRYKPQHIRPIIICAFLNQAKDLN